MGLTVLKEKERDCLCPQCAGLCCRYVALPIETPETKDDYDDVRWYLAHEGFSVFVEDDEWYVNIASRCKYLNANNMCSIYEKRPKICRKYSDDNCDYHGGDYGYDLYFSCAEDLEEYMDKKFNKKKKKK